MVESLLDPPRSRLVGRIWVTGTVLLISFIAFSSQIFVIWPSYGSELSAELLRLLGPFNALIAMLFYNYYLCIKTDPGKVPRGWEPPRDGSDQILEVKRLTGGPRYCRSCRAYKPPRAHHCRQCQKCVLKMDHHCPWVNNCVGHHNYGHFIRFLFLVDISCMYHLCMITFNAFGRAMYSFEPTTTEVIMLILNYTTCVPVLLAVGIFSLFHFYFLATNTTTIEGWEKDKVAMLMRRGKIEEVKFPYDLGIVANIQSTLGRNPLLWCWPQRTSGDGLSYKTGKNVGKLAWHDSVAVPDPFDPRAEDTGGRAGMSSGVEVRGEYRGIERERSAPLEDV